MVHRVLSIDMCFVRDLYVNLKTKKCPGFVAGSSKRLERPEYTRCAWRGLEEHLHLRITLIFARIIIIYWTFAIFC